MPLIDRAVSPRPRRPSAGVGVHELGVRHRRRRRPRRARGRGGEQERRRAPKRKVSHHGRESTGNVRVGRARTAVPREVTRADPAMPTTPPTYRARCLQHRPTRRSPVGADAGTWRLAIAVGPRRRARPRRTPRRGFGSSSSCRSRAALVSLEQARRHFCAGFALAGIRNFGTRDRRARSGGRGRGRAGGRPARRRWSSFGVLLRLIAAAITLALRRGRRSERRITAGRHRSDGPGDGRDDSRPDVSSGDGTCASGRLTITCSIPSSA